MVTCFKVDVMHFCVDGIPGWRRVSILKVPEGVIMSVNVKQFSWVSFIYNMFIAEIRIWLIFIFGDRH